MALQGRNPLRRIGFGKRRGTAKRVFLRVLFGGWIHLVFGVPPQQSQNRLVQNAEYALAATHRQRHQLIHVVLADLSEAFLVFAGKVFNLNHVISFLPFTRISFQVIVSKFASLCLICSSFSLSRTSQPKGPRVWRMRICQEGFEPPKSGLSAVLGTGSAGGRSHRRTRFDLGIYEMVKLETIVVFEH